MCGEGLRRSDHRLDNPHVCGEGTFRPGVPIAEPVIRDYYAHPDRGMSRGCQTTAGGSACCFFLNLVETPEARYSGTVIRRRRPDRLGTDPIRVVNWQKPGAIRPVPAPRGDAAHR